MHRSAGRQAGAAYRKAAGLNVWGTLKVLIEASKVVERIAPHVDLLKAPACGCRMERRETGW